MGTDFIDILETTKGGYPWAGLRLLRCWGSSRSAQGCWRLVEAREAQRGNGPAEAKWVVGCGLCWRAGLSPPYQNEAAAVVRLVWPAGCRRAVRVALLAHGPLEISRK